MGTAALIYSILLYTFELPVWTVLIMLCARGIGSTFQQPAIQSIIPQLVPADRLLRTNGWMQHSKRGLFPPGAGYRSFALRAFPDTCGAHKRYYRCPFRQSGFGGCEGSASGEKEKRKAESRKEYREGLEIFKRDRRLLLLTGAEAMGNVFLRALSILLSSYDQRLFSICRPYTAAVWSWHSPWE